MLKKVLPASLAVCILIATGASLASQKVFGVDDDSLNEVTSPPSPDTFERVHLSHSGLYFDSPISRGAPPYLSFHLHAPLYPLEGVELSVASVRNRSWEQIFLGCGPLEGGSIEHCELDDKRAADEQSKIQRIEQRCSIAKVIESQSRLLIDAESCPVMASILKRQEPGVKHAEGYLESVTLTLDVQRIAPVRRERHHFWLARLHRPTYLTQDGGALWPYAGTATKGDDSRTVKYTGITPNRIDSLMQDPYMPRAYRSESNDPLNGVDLTFITWSYGIAIRSPSNGNSSDSSDPPFEPVHAPVDGQVVWLGNYELARAPSNGRNNERGHAIMIRDEWGTVFQLLGVDKDATKVFLGEYVKAGQHVSGTSRTPISREPPCRHKPADPPKMDDDSRRYPFRFRLLRVLVARPARTWTEWQPPFASGWTYFNPLDVFTIAGRTNEITPDPNPAKLFFADPTEDTALTPPKIVASSTDLIQPPRLSGKVEVIVEYDTFLDTPGDSGGQKAYVGLHGLDYAVVWQGSLPAVTSGSIACEAAPRELEWQTSFEHAKMPNGWTLPLAKTNLLAHYVPAFTVGSVPLFKTKFASQYDDKSRKLFYAPTRILNGQIDSRGSWETRKERQGDGLYQVWVRGRDWFGNQGCVVANVRVQNGA